MKKFLLSVSLVALCLCLVGCSNTQKDLSAKLDAHLNRLSATISSVQDIKNSEITYQAAINQAPSSTTLLLEKIQIMTTQSRLLTLQTKLTQQSIKTCFAQTTISARAKAKFVNSLKC